MDRDAFADKIVNYVITHPRFEEFTPLEAARVTVNVLLHDIGAANDFLEAIGVDLNLYTYDFPGVTEVDKGLLRCTFSRDEMARGDGNKAKYIEEKLTSHKFDLKQPIRRDYDIGKDLVVYTQRKEVSNADRTEGTPEGSAQVPDQWKNFVRWRGVWKDGDHPGVLRGERKPT